ncbi:MAG: ABC transporter ATP-binding protein [Tissierellia bacterium]|mgnify:CR=1 FL=1|nr:ABC transporter ATP-binding protein [Bacillota bacterium]NLL22696.1 ABC transporter ATP-binding protein [Tissierellia bacterium]
MKALFKKHFALTEQGATDLVKSSLATFAAYVVNMFPAMLLMMFFDKTLLLNERSNGFYYVASAVVLVLVYIALSVEYDSLFNATYKESENLRIDIARNLSDLPLSYFSKHDLTDLAQTIMADVATLEHALSHSIAKIIGFGGFFILISSMLLISNVKLGLCVISPIVVYYTLILLSKRIQTKSFHKYYKKRRENSDGFQEAIELQAEIQSFAMSEDIKKKLYREVEEGEKIHIASEFVGVTILGLAGLILYITHILVIIVGVSLLAEGEMNILYFLGFLLAGIKIKEGAEANAMNMAELFMVDSVVKRIGEIRNVKRQEGEDKELSDFDIELKDVSFSYDDSADVLDGVTFTAKQNEVTALVGKSGCGKTSILRLVSRLYDVTGGEILISNENINNISTKSLFDKVSIVFQDVTLFDTSVMENIRIGKPDATDEEVKKAAKLANCDDFIEKLENGYDTLIGENGANLSGGERQRLSIARAFLKDAPIIILDEIAAALDVDNENKIQDSLNKLTKDKTVLIISHRLKSIQNVDKIVVIDGGKVESEGKHEELLKTSRVYKDLIDKTALAEEFVY